MHRTHRGIEIEVNLTDKVETRKAIWHFIRGGLDSVSIVYSAEREIEKLREILYFD